MQFGKALRLVDILFPALERRDVKRRTEKIALAVRRVEGCLAVDQRQRLAVDIGQGNFTFGLEVRRHHLDVGLAQDVGLVTEDLEIILADNVVAAKTGQLEMGPVRVNVAIMLILDEAGCRQFVEDCAEQAVFGFPSFQCVAGRPEVCHVYAQAKR